MSADLELRNFIVSMGVELDLSQQPEILGGISATRPYRQLWTWVVQTIDIYLFACKV